MRACKTLARTPLSLFICRKLHNHTLPPSLSPMSLSFLPHTYPGLRLVRPVVASRCYTSAQGAASAEAINYAVEAEAVSTNLIIEPPEEQLKDTVELLLTNPDDVGRFMKMERKSLETDGGAEPSSPNRWFPYLDRFKCGNAYLSSSEILEAVSPCISDVRKERFRNVVKNRSYSVCLVVEGLSDFGNVSAAFRSADALGFQSVHVVSGDSSKRCNDN